MRGTIKATIVTMFVLVAACSDGNDSTATTTAPTAPDQSQSISESPDCETVTSRTVDALQAYVDIFAGVSVDAVGTVTGQGQQTLDEVATEMRTRAQELECEPAALREHLSDEVTRLHGDGPIAEGVAATFRSALVGGEDPSDSGPGEFHVRTSSELESTLAIAGSGSTVDLAEGEYEVDQTLVLFRPVTITGAGRDRTTITSTAGGAAILSLASETLTVRDLTVRHAGDAPASVLVVRGGRTRIEGAQLSGARRDPDRSEGGYGLLLRGTAGDEDSRITATTFNDNAGGGIVVGASEAPSLSSVVIEGGGPCGICYLEESGGTLEDVDIRDHEIGVQVTGSATPTIVGGTIADNDVGLVFAEEAAGSLEGLTVSGGLIGVQVEGRASPRLRRLTVTSAGEAAVIITGQSQPDINEVTCDDSDTGVIVVFEEADPNVGEDIDCLVAVGRDE